MHENFYVIYIKFKKMFTIESCFKIYDYNVNQIRLHRIYKRLKFQIQNFIVEEEIIDFNPYRLNCLIPWVCQKSAHNNEIIIGAMRLKWFK